MHFQKRVVEGYKLESRLGRGSFGSEVWKATKDGKMYAIKLMSVEDGTAELEASIASNIKFLSPFLVKYYNTFHLDDYVFIVMELCEQGDLGAFLKTLDKSKGIALSTDRIMKIFIQLVLGVHELHDKNIIHRNLKPANLFIDNNDDMKIGDFGTAKMLDFGSQKTNTAIGTPSYMAPEIVENKPYDKKCDLWSLGVLLYQLSTLELPFTHPNQYMIPLIVAKGEYKRIPKNTVPDDIIDTIYSLLTPNPDQRPSTSDLLQLPLLRSFGDRLGLRKFFPVK